MVCCFCIRYFRCNYVILQPFCSTKPRQPLTLVKGSKWFPNRKSRLPPAAVASAAAVQCSAGMDALWRALLFCAACISVCFGRKGLRVTFPVTGCLSYCSLAVTKHHDKAAERRKHLIGLHYSFRGSVHSHRGRKHGSRQADMHGPGAVAESSRRTLSHSAEIGQDWAWHGPLKPLSPPAPARPPNPPWTVHQLGTEHSNLWAGDAIPMPNHHTEEHWSFSLAWNLFLEAL